jgi:hypothetical protein
MSTDTPRAAEVLLAPLTWDTPAGLPFLGAEPPACSEPAAALAFEMAGTQHCAAAAIRVCKRTCAECPYLMACREWAIAEREPWGVWGGLTPRERSAEWRRSQNSA